MPTHQKFSSYTPGLAMVKLKVLLYIYLAVVINKLSIDSFFNCFSLFIVTIETIDTRNHKVYMVSIYNALYKLRPLMKGAMTNVSSGIPLI